MTGRSFLVRAAVLGLVVLGLLLWRGQREAPRATSPAPQVESEPDVPAVDAATDGRRAVDGEDAGPEHTAIRVLVRDLAGKPISGARVRATDDPQAEATTDETGSCALALPWREWIRIEATASGYLGAWDRLPWKEETTLELSRACTLLGRVLDADTREPIAGADVWISGKPKWIVPESNVQTDEVGAFRFERAPVTKDLAVRAGAEGYSSQQGSWDVSRSGDPVSVELLLTRTTRLEITVLEHPSDLPLAGAEVNGVATTDEAGRASLEADSQPDGSLEVFVEVSGHCSLAGTVRRGAVEGPLVVRLPLLGRFEGIVRDEKGAALSGAELSFDERFFLEPSSPDEVWKPSLPDPPPGWSYGGETSASATTDAEGRFVSTDLLPSPRSFDVRMSHPEGGELEREAGHVLPGEATWVELSATRVAKGRIEGRVLLNGRAVEGGLRWTNGSRSGGAWVRDGSYQDVVDAGQVELRLRLDEPDFSQLGRDAEFLSATVTVAEGETVRHDFDITLPLGTIAGRVSQEDGRPLSGLFVILEEDQGRMRRATRTEDDGRWQEEVLDLDTEYRVSAERGGVTAEATAHVGESDVELVLPLCGELPIRVCDARTDRRIERWDVAFRRGGGSSWKVESPTTGRNHPRPDGSLVLTLAEGEYELWAHAWDEGYAPERIEGVVVRAGETSEPMKFGLRPGLELEIALEGDVPPAESTIVLLEPEIWASVQAGPDLSDPTLSLGGVPYAAGSLSAFTLSNRIVIFTDGRHAKVSRLSAGEYRFKAFPPGIVIESASVVLPHEGPLTIRWRYE